MDKNVQRFAIDLTVIIVPQGPDGRIAGSLPVTIHRVYYASNLVGIRQLLDSLEGKNNVETGRRVSSNK